MQPPVALSAPIHPVSTANRQLQGLRIGIYRRWFEDVCDPEISRVCYSMLEKLCNDHGAVLVDIEIPELFENGKAHNITIVGEMLAKVYVSHGLFRESDSTHNYLPPVNLD